MALLWKILIILAIAAAAVGFGWFIYRTEETKKGTWHVL